MINVIILSFFRQKTLFLDALKWLIYRFLRYFLVQIQNHLYNFTHFLDQLITRGWGKFAFQIITAAWVNQACARHNMLPCPSPTLQQKTWLGFADF